MKISFPCPSCSAPLESCGEATADDAEFDIFQCDRCERDVMIFGETFAESLTFAVRRGTLTPLDSGSLEPLIENSFRRVQREAGEA